MRRALWLTLGLVCLAAAVAAPAPLGTAFIYQGRLIEDGAPATGAYDLEFRLLDAATGGNPVGPTLVRTEVPVANGLFNVSLDFGESAFVGEARWLEIGVRKGGTAGPFATLGERQELTPAPNAVFAARASDADRLAGQLSSAYAAASHDHDHGSLTSLGSDHHPQYFHLGQPEVVTLPVTINSQAGADLVIAEGQISRDSPANEVLALTNPGAGRLDVVVDSIRAVTSGMATPAYSRADDPASGLHIASDGFGAILVAGGSQRVWAAAGGVELNGPLALLNTTAIQTTSTIQGAAGRAVTNTSNSATPSVANASLLFLDYAGVAVTITSLTDGVEGQCVVIVSADGVPDIFDGGSFRLAAGWSPDADDTLTVCLRGGVWYETSRSPN
jgi:hypothetical protein